MKIYTPLPIFWNILQVFKSVHIYQRLSSFIHLFNNIFLSCIPAMLAALLASEYVSFVLYMTSLERITRSEIWRPEGPWQQRNIAQPNSAIGSFLLKKQHIWNHDVDFKTWCVYVLCHVSLHPSLYVVRLSIHSALKFDQSFRLILYYNL